MSPLRLLAGTLAILGSLPTMAAQEIRRPAPASAPPVLGRPIPPQPPKPVERLEQRGSTRWHVLRKDYREYVRFEDIKAFYQFENLDIIGDEVILEAPQHALSMRFLAGMRLAQFKTYTCFLSFPPVRFEDRLYLSRVDLALLLDPTIRPPTLTLADGKKLSVLVEVVPKDELAVEVARHVKHGLEAFDMEVITSLSRETSDETILGGIRLLEQDETEELQTLTLAPHGTPVHGEKTAPANSPSPARGNNQDRLNIAMGMALHATLMENVDGILDGGLTRDRMRFLREASRPAVAIRLPAASAASAEVFGAAIVRGLRKFRDTASR